MLGGVLIYGVIDPNSAANAITDAKQIRAGENVYVSQPASATMLPRRQQCNDKNDKDMGGSSNPATVRNNATAGDVTSDGNTGVNVAAGQYNMQQNSANLAVSAKRHDPNCRSAVGDRLRRPAISRSSGNQLTERPTSGVARASTIRDRTNGTTHEHCFAVASAATATSATTSRRARSTSSRTC